MVGERGEAGGPDRADIARVSKTPDLVGASVRGRLASYLVAVVLACAAELQKSVRISGSLWAAMHAVKGIWARTVGAEASPSSRRRSASWSSSVETKVGLAGGCFYPVIPPLPPHDKHS